MTIGCCLVWDAGLNISLPGLKHRCAIWKFTLVWNTSMLLLGGALPGLKHGVLIEIYYLKGGARFETWADICLWWLLHVLVNGCRGTSCNVGGYPSPPEMIREVISIRSLHQVWVNFLHSVPCSVSQSEYPFISGLEFEFFVDVFYIQVNSFNVLICQFPKKIILKGLYFFLCMTGMLYTMG